MKEKAKKIITSPYFIIVSVYFLAHFFMLLLSGCWWDDWTFMTHNLEYINEVASQSGRPEWNILVPLCWSLPNNGRILIFFLYLCNSIFVYEILKHSDLFDERSSLLIALLFTIIPVNDARILISNFGYTVGLFFFYLAFMCFVRWNKMKKSTSKSIFRIIVLLLFYVSFILNSVLAYYYIVIAYLFVLEMMKAKDNSIVNNVVVSVKNVLVHYPDFFIVPFVYYGMNKLLFPTYGEVFGSYNSVTIEGLIKCITYIPISVIKVFVDMVKKWLSCINIITTILIICIGIYIWFRTKDENPKEYNIIDSIKYFVFGMFVLIMGIFPYVMVRGRAIDTIGVKGRDAVLVSFGAAIIIYSFIIMLKGKIRRVITIILLTLGMLGFNSLYIEWQKDYYYQLSLENLLNNDIIRNNDTFFLAELNETEIEAQRYYSLNANAYNVFGDETRFFIPKVSNLYILKDKEEVDETISVLAYSHRMKDYNPDDYYFDAILDFSCNLEWDEVLALKYYEIFDLKEFDRRIKNNGTLAITVVDDDFTKILLKEYDNGKLHNDKDVLQLLLSYEN